MKRRKQNWKQGDILKIPLNEKHISFARVLQFPLIAFYSLRATDEADIETIISSPIAFKIWVMEKAVTSGNWPVIGHKPLTPDLEELPLFFKRDPITNSLSLYGGDGSEKPASISDCQGLECAAVWDPKHVMDRLNDYFEGRPNRWVELMSPKNPK